MLTVSRLVQVIRESGLRHALRAGTRELVGRATSSYWYFRAFKSHRTFTFDGRRYRYFYHRYNTTWKTERVVEVPIVWDIVRRHRGRRILEVGNVLAHYFPVAHDRLDKYEQGEGVINQDVVDFRAERPYDLIVSISTLEHVGWDEETRDPQKILRAIENLEGLLAPGGTMVVTLPLAYNPNADALLREGRIRFTRRHCLKRTSHDNRWAEVEWTEIEGSQFDAPFRRINGLVIGVIEAGRQGS